MAQLKSTSINGNLSVTGNFNMNATYSGNLNALSGFNCSALLYKVGNIVFGYVNWSTQSTKTVPAWQWTQIGTWPSAFVPGGGISLVTTIQTAGGGNFNINVDGTVWICPYNTVGGSNMGGLQFIYPM